MSNSNDTLKMNACILKYIELALTIACITLHHYSYDLTDVPVLVLCSGTFIGFLIVLSGQIIGDMVCAPVDIVVDIFYSAVGSGLCTACGVALLMARLRTDRPGAPPRTGDDTTALALGGVSIFCGTVMLLDLVLAYCNTEVYDEEESI